MREDTKRLIDEVDIKTLLESLGIQIHSKSSGYNFIQCPIPTHHDNHPTNCFFKDGDSYVYCAVCNQGIGAIDLLHYTKGYDFKESISYLYELSGRPSWFTLFDDIKKKGKSQKGEIKEKEFFVSYKENETLGLKIKPIWKEFLSEKEIKNIILSRALKRKQDIIDIQSILNKNDILTDENSILDNILDKVQEKNKNKNK